MADTVANMRIKKARIRNHEEDKDKWLQFLIAQKAVRKRKQNSNWKTKYLPITASPFLSNCQTVEAHTVSEQTHAHTAQHK